ncbi:amidase [Wenzhouxiangella sediminis]|uniref:Amidase n=1 Tax=Wenzhouxiangella sediminis TaxID=1792836 RepID=A0A3E1KBA5_9GAMM|nr:amidase [Wenzhouxiangella sediminis]RFF31837.1 amidase [Wenzhouxiangella sediminis]
MRLLLTVGFLFLALPATAQELPNVAEMDVAAIQAGYEAGDFTARDITAAYLERIERLDRSGPMLNSLRHVNENALQRAAELDRERAEGKVRGPLHGIPVLIKDNIDTADMPTTAGSVWLEGVVPLKDAFIVERLRKAGAIILGKTNLSEWANFHSSSSSSGWSRLGGQVKNPYDLQRNPCGSSSGSGAAAAAGLATLTIGTETNGSIVCPSNANGIVGLKPTVGLVSRSGIIPISHSSDSAGPMTRTVRDAAVLLGVLAGEDPADDKTVGDAIVRHSDYTQFLDAGALEGKRLGLWTGPTEQNHRVKALTRQAAAALESAGAEIVEIETITEENIGGDALNVLLYEFHHGMDAYLAALGDRAPFENYKAMVEAVRNDPEETARFDRALLFRAADKDDIESQEYLEALARVLEHSREKGIDRVLAEHELDAIIAPTGSPAWMTDPILGDNFQLSSSSPSARAGYPIITVPMGHIEGLPVGLSFFSTAWSEPTLLALAYAFEQATQARVQPGL